MSRLYSIFLACLLWIPGCLEPPKVSLGGEDVLLAGDTKLPFDSGDFGAVDVPTPDIPPLDIPDPIDVFTNDGFLNPMDGVDTSLPATGLCGDYYDCLVEKGCPCEPDGTFQEEIETCEESWFSLYPAGATCMVEGCQDKVGCDQSCLDLLSDQAEIARAAFEECRTAKLPGCENAFEGDFGAEEEQACLAEHCWDEYRGCFGDGTGECADVWSCVLGCSDSDGGSKLLCTIQCGVNASPEAVDDVTEIVECLPNADLSGGVKNAVVCVGSLGSCLAEEGKSAPEVMQCILALGGDDINGVFACLFGLGQGEVSTLENLWTCGRDCALDPECEDPFAPGSEPDCNIAWKAAGGCPGGSYFDLDSCDECADWAYPESGDEQCSVFCDAALTCSGHGTCSDEVPGGCVCVFPFTGDDCSECTGEFRGENCDQPRFVGLSSGDDSVCGWTELGRVLCWGTEECATQEEECMPPAGRRFSEVKAGENLSCGKDKDSGELLCWGQSAGHAAMLVPFQRYDDFGVGEAFVCGSYPLNSFSTGTADGLGIGCSGSGGACPETESNFRKVACWGDEDSPTVDQASTEVYDLAVMDVGPGGICIAHREGDSDPVYPSHFECWGAPGCEEESYAYLTGFEASSCLPSDTAAILDGCVGGAGDGYFFTRTRAPNCLLESCDTGDIGFGGEQICQKVTVGTTSHLCDETECVAYGGLCASSVSEGCGCDDDDLQGTSWDQVAGVTDLGVELDIPIACGADYVCKLKLPPSTGPLGQGTEIVIEAGGQAQCWGHQGPVAEDSVRWSNEPEQNFIDLSARGLNPCGLTAGGEVICWGEAEVPAFEGLPSQWCVPMCHRRACGDNGCGGTCGDCDDGESCDADTGACVFTGCLTDETEPNDHCVDAPLLGAFSFVGGDWHYYDGLPGVGSFHGKSDRDLYRLILENKGIETKQLDFLVHFSGSDGLGLTGLKVLQADTCSEGLIGAAFAWLTLSVDGGVEKTSLLQRQVEPDASETVYMVVSPVTELEVCNSEKAYTLETSLVPCSLDWHEEVDGKLQNKLEGLAHTSSDLNFHWMGGGGLEKDVDWFYYAVPEPGSVLTVTISVTYTLDLGVAEDFAPGIELFVEANPDGGFYQSVGVVNGVSEENTVVLTYSGADSLVGGTHQVRISPHPDQPTCDALLSYDLTIDLEVVP